MYNTINDTLKAYLQTNEDVLDPIEKKRIEAAQAYTEYWATSEAEQHEISSILTELKLKTRFIGYITAIQDLYIQPDFTDIKSTLKDLQYIDEALAYEEENYLGLSKTAKYHRKAWRHLCRKLKKQFKKIIKGQMNYYKEWSKPKTRYVSKYTGEVHNGLYWTIRACIDMPAMILCGFTKEN